jgi:hypothetical protein
MLSGLGYFKYEVKPTLYNNADGSVSKQLEITVAVNGEPHTVLRVVPNQPANYNEVEYYTKLATEALLNALARIEVENEASHERS